LRRGTRCEDVREPRKPWSCCLEKHPEILMLMVVLTSIAWTDRGERWEASLLADRIET